MDTNDRDVLAPEQLGSVSSLLPEAGDDLSIRPDTPVLFVQRGQAVIEDMHDSKTHLIPPGYGVGPFAAVKHFKDRAVVPGSRNPETNTQASFIAILGSFRALKGGGYEILKRVDAAEECTPFTEEECRIYGVAYEAIDRDALVDPITPNAKVVDTRTLQAPGAKGAPAKSRVKAAGGNDVGGRARTRPAPAIEQDKGEVLEKVKYEEIRDPNTDKVIRRGEKLSGKTMNEATAAIASDRQDAQNGV